MDVPLILVVSLAVEFNHNGFQRPDNFLQRVLILLGKASNGRTVDIQYADYIANRESSGRHFTSVYIGVPVEHRITSSEREAVSQAM